MSKVKFIVFLFLNFWWLTMTANMIVLVIGCNYGCLVHLQVLINTITNCCCDKQKAWDCGFGFPEGMNFIVWDSILLLLFHITSHHKIIYLEMVGRGISTAMWFIDWLIKAVNSWHVEQVDSVGIPVEQFNSAVHTKYRQLLPLPGVHKVKFYNIQIRSQ